MERVSAANVAGHFALFRERGRNRHRGSFLRFGKEGLADGQIATGVAVVTNHTEYNRFLRPFSAQTFPSPGSAVG
jgi:hypothetical protein